MNLNPISNKPASAWYFAGFRQYKYLSDAEKKKWRVAAAVCIPLIIAEHVVLKKLKKFLDEVERKEITLDQWAGEFRKMHPEFNPDPDEWPLDAAVWAERQQIDTVEDIEAEISRAPGLEEQ